MLYLSEFAFLMIPIAMLAFFVVSLILYCVGKAKKKHNPDSITDKQMKTRLWLLIISSVMAGLMLAVAIGFTALMYMAVAFM